MSATPAAAPPISLAASPGQTVGPFFRYGLEFEHGGELIPAGSPGSIRLFGRVLDGAGDGIPDALVEIWQADAAGLVPTADGTLRRSSSNAVGAAEFSGFGRVHVSDTGEYEFHTVDPGAGFISVVVFARGLMDRLHSRIYLPERAAAQPDAFLASLTEEERATVIATRTSTGDLQHDLRLQGERETVFLAFR